MSTSVERGYRLAEHLAAANGHTYHLAARLLPGPNRRAVHALYGFARTVDDVVDDMSQNGADDLLLRLDDLFGGLSAALRGDVADDARGDGEADLLAAVADSAGRFNLDPAHFTAFEHSMRMDVPTASEHTPRYRDMAHLREYTHGSAAIIGLLLVPILGADPHDAATNHGAALLGEAFQLTNFLRDVGEDLDRDRIYLPTEELAAFGVDESHLRACRARRRVTPQLRRALAHLTAVNRDWYRCAERDIDALPRRTRPAIRAAARSYADILRVIEQRGYEVFDGRAVVPSRTRVRHAVAALF